MSLWTTTALAALLLLVAWPYVAYVRHPEQRPFAAYLIFVTVFVVAAMVLLFLVLWLAGMVGILPLGDLAWAVLLLTLVLVPALLIATWQARKPPTHRHPPP
jgi:hypothetical protein